MSFLFWVWVCLVLVVVNLFSVVKIVVGVSIVGCWWEVNFCCCCCCFLGDEEFLWFLFWRVFLFEVFVMNVLFLLFFIIFYILFFWCNLFVVMDLYVLDLFLFLWLFLCFCGVVVGVVVVVGLGFLLKYIMNLVVDVVCMSGLFVFVYESWFWFRLLLLLLLLCGICIGFRVCSVGFF